MERVRAPRPCVSIPPQSAGHDQQRHGSTGESATVTRASRPALRICVLTQYNQTGANLHRGVQMSIRLVLAGLATISLLHAQTNLPRSLSDADKIEVQV